MRRLIPLVGLVSMLALASCGDDEKPTDPPSAAQPATTQEQSAAPEPTPLELSTAERRELRERLERQEGLSAPLVPVAERLETAGYQQGAPAGLPEGTLGTMSVIDGQMTVTIYSYRSKSDAAAAQSRLTELESEQPDQAEIAERGKRIYFGTVTAPDGLDATRFTRIVDIGEGAEG